MKLPSPAGTKILFLILLVGVRLVGFFLDWLGWALQVLLNHPGHIPQGDRSIALLPDVDLILGLGRLFLAVVCEFV